MDRANVAGADWSGLSDVDLVVGAAEARPGAFAALMHRHNRKLYRAARSVTGDDGEAEDVVQEAWMHAYAHIAEFRNESAISTWLVRIALNEALGRKRRAMPMSEINETIELQMSSVIGFPARAPDPESALSRTQVRRRLEQAIDTLPAAFRAVFVLRAVEEMSGADVAQQLEIPEATVKTRLHRARAMLRRELEKDFGACLTDVFPFDGARCAQLSERVLAILAPSR